MRAKLGCDELKIDIDKQLAADASTITDPEQRLAAAKKLVGYFQYVGEDFISTILLMLLGATKWQQAQTVIRHRLRQVFDGV